MPHVELPQAEFKVRSDARLRMSTNFGETRGMLCIENRRRTILFQNAWDTIACSIYISSLSIHYIRSLTLLLAAQQTHTLHMD